MGERGTGIPVVDLSEAVGSVAEKWGKAMEGFGFALIVGHGIPKDLLERTFEASREFFLNRSKEEKMKFNFGKYGNPDGGFTPAGVEAVARTFQGAESPPDLVESFVLRNQAVDEDSRLSKQCKECKVPLFDVGKEYREKVIELTKFLNVISAKALGVNDDFFNQFFDKDPTISLRCAHYPPLDSNVKAGQFRYGAHQDYEHFTILAVEEEDTGLEVFVQNEWVKVKCPPGALIVNVGELTSHWTGQKWKATIHRVQNPSMDSEAAKSHRFSLPCFTAPNPDALVIPMFGDGKPIRAIDHLLLQLNKSNI